jgi:hypothetical protein
MRNPLSMAVSAFLITAHGLAGVAAEAQVVSEMTPAAIKGAIADAKNDGCYTLRRGYACFTTPYSRVARAAQAAKKKYEPFTEASVTPEMIAPVVEVLAWPQPSFIMGRGRNGPPIDVNAIVVMPAKSKDASAAILPTEKVDLDSRYQNMLGASFEAKGLVARFPLSVLIPGNEVRVVYAGKGCASVMNKLSEECSMRFDLKDVK